VIMKQNAKIRASWKPRHAARHALMIVLLFFRELLGTRLDSRYVFVFRVGISNIGMREGIVTLQPLGKP